MKPSTSLTLLLATLFSLAALSPSSLRAETFIPPVPYVVPAVVEDRQEFQVPNRIQLSGMLGARIHANTYTRLLETVDVDRILQKYHTRDTQEHILPYDGEHIGKFIHAATLSWANSGNEKLHAKVANAVIELIKTQEANSYLVCCMSDEQIAAADKQQPKEGTSKPKFLKRWTNWDTWSHIDNMTGLLTWARFTA